MLNESNSLSEKVQAAATCHFPEKMVGKPVASMNKDDLHCGKNIIILLFAYTYSGMASRPRALIILGQGY